MKVHSRRKSERTRILATLAVALVFIVLGLLLPRLFSYVSTVVLTPLDAVVTWLRYSDERIPVYFRDREALHSTIEALEQELVIAGRSDVTTQRLYEENIRLRSLLHVGTTTRIAAAVIGRPIKLPYDYLHIDRGTDAGIVEGAPVYIGEEHIIGFVSLATPKHSFVELITTPGFAATAFVSGADVTATLEGMGGGVARLRVPQGIPLQVGNPVYLPSIEPGIFGRVSYVENQPTQPEQYGYVTPNISLASIHYVAVAPDVRIAESADIVRERIKNIQTNNLLVPEFASSTASTTDLSQVSTTTTP